MKSFFYKSTFIEFALPPNKEINPDDKFVVVVDDYYYWEFNDVG